MTYAHRLVVIQEQGVLIVVILNGNKVVRSIKLNYRSGVEPIAPNVFIPATDCAYTTKLNK